MALQDSPSAGKFNAARTGESFVQSRAFEVLSRVGFVARALIYAIIGVLALKLAIRSGRQADEPAGSAAHGRAPAVRPVPASRSSRSVSAATRLWRLVRAGVGHGPEGSDTGFERVAALGERDRVRGAVRRSRSRSCSGPAGAGPESAQEGAAGVFGWPRRHLDRRHRRCRDDRRRPLPGLPRRHEEVSRRLEDRGRWGRGCGRGSAGSGRSGTSRGWSCSGSSGSSSSRPRSTTTRAQAVGLDGALAKIVHQSYGPFSSVSSRPD